MTSKRRLSTLRFPLSFALICCLWSSQAAADDWPQWLGPQRDGKWRETGIVEKFPPGGPPLVWKVPVGGGYSGPAVAGERVFVMDRQVAADQTPPPKNKLGDPTKGLGKGTERLLCLSAKDGKALWKHEYECAYSKIAYPSGPRATPLVSDGRVYALGTMGDLNCLEADSGKLVWKVQLPTQYATAWPVWGYAAHPLIVGNQIITLVGGPGSAVVALDRKTGKEVWKALTTEEIGYAPPVLVKAAGREQLIVWLSESLNGLDPATGKVFWSIPHPEDGKPQRPSVNIMTPRVFNNQLFVSNFYHGPLVVQLADGKPEAKVQWRSKSNNPSKPHGINPVMSTPIVKDGFVYGLCGMGELRCINLNDGATKWETLEVIGGRREQFATAFFVEHEDRCFVFNELGELMICRLTPEKFHKIDSTQAIKATMPSRGGRDVVWCHPAFARRCMFVRNDEELVCLSLAKNQQS